MYQFSEESKDLQLHSNLFTKEPIKNAMAIIKIINGCGTVAVDMDEGIRKEYLDEAENVFFFHDFPSECVSMSVSPSVESRCIPS